MALTPLYTTELGEAYCADSLELMRTLPSGSIDLVVTSPPYALHFKKEYGNADQGSYVEWFLPFAHEIKRVLKPTGSFVLNVGGAWTPGAPLRSLYHFRLLIALCDEVGYQLCQEFFWYNPAKMPAPAEWVNVRRVRVKDSVEYVFWLSATPHPDADNSRVLQEYSQDMKRLIRRGARKTVRPSGHNITEKFANDKGGSIPPNLIECGNNESNSTYIRASKLQGKKVHPARFPARLPEFFIKFLSEPGETVLDPFAGSNTTGSVAQRLGRRWIAIEMDPLYAADSELLPGACRGAVVECGSNAFLGGRRLIRNATLASRRIDGGEPSPGCSDAVVWRHPYGGPALATQLTREEREVIGPRDYAGQSQAAMAGRRARSAAS